MTAKGKIFFCLLFVLSVSPVAARAELSFQGTHILAYRTMGLLADAYQKKSGRKVLVRGGGCADGMRGLVDGRHDMGGLCCPADRQELGRLGLRAHAVARDVKVAMVNPANPLRSLTADQLRALHQGRITNWRQLGWEDRPVAIILRKHCPNMDEPVRRFLGIDQRFSNLASRAITVQTDQELVDRVERFPAAIGVTSRVFARGRQVRMLALGGVEAWNPQVMKGAYSFTTPLYIVTRDPMSPELRRFLNFVRSGEGQRLVATHLAVLP